MSATAVGLHVEADSQNFYDARFKSGYMDEWPEQKKQRVFEVLRELDLPEIGEALDFGCGNGVLTEIIRLARPKWRVYGTDFSTAALEGAKARYPEVRFFAPSAPEIAGKHYDVVFTHHVLEHVYNLEEVWGQIIRRVKPGGGVLHILPCGNEGSLEHRICTLRVDGIDAKCEDRFFFEDEGHLRRVTTERMVRLAANSGLELAREYYACQHYGAIDWITAYGVDFVHTVTDVEYAKDVNAKHELLRIRKALMTRARARRVVSDVRQRQAEPAKTLKSRISLALRMPLFAVCKFIDWHTTRQSDNEWQRRRQERAGSEMYLYFRMLQPTVADTSRSAIRI